MQTAHSLSLLRSDDPLADLYAQVVAEGIALNVDPEALLRATAEAFEYIVAPARKGLISVRDD